MKTASMVLGIIGGAFAMLLAVGLIIGAIACFSVDSWGDFIKRDFSWYFSSNGNTWHSGEWDSDEWSFKSDDGSWSFKVDGDEFPADEVAAVAIAGAGTLLLVTGIFAFISGALGLIGGCIAKSKSSAAGVMMIVAAVLSLFAMFNVVSMILFILGGIFALKKDTPAPAMPYPPYPPQPPHYGNQYPPAPPQMPSDGTEPPPQ